MTTPAFRSRIVVVGSANQDYIVRVSEPPGPGETVLADSLLKQPGGKGANQAVAAARLQGDVSLIAAVGDDTDGAFLLRELRSEGVDTTNVEIMSREQTGLALVSVFDSGENSITVVPGSNFSMTSERIAATVSRLAEEADSVIVVVQAELKPAIIETALRTAENSSARVILNLAPYQPLSPDVLALCDPLVINETEASDLVGRPVHDVATALAAINDLRHRARSVVITIGAQGAVWANADEEGHVPAPAVPKVVDTTGAGDAFVGALAAKLATGATLKEAIDLGVCAGSFAVQSFGAQTSYPTLSDLRLVGYLAEVSLTTAD